MAKAQKLGGWMTRLKRCIDAEAGAEVSKKVIIKTEQFDATSNYAQKAEWIRNAVQRLEKEAGESHSDQGNAGLRYEVLRSNATETREAVHGRITLG